VTFTPLDIEGSYLITPQVFGDERGYFFERFSAKAFEAATGISATFVQDNESMSNKGVVRGLHMQTGEMAQAKLVAVPKGAVNDIIVDVRPQSASYLKHIVVPLNAQNKQMLYIPTGCVHGFETLEDNTIFQYKCSNYYSKAHEAGVYLFDEQLAIQFATAKQDMIVSEKDQALPLLKDFVATL
jgi:dTDP-4-dehydrorhamnose 3,5-epimerase